MSLNREDLKNDLEYFWTKLHNDFVWFDNLNTDRQGVIIEMCFMGYKNFLTFKKMICALSLGDYKKSAQEILNSRWAHKFSNRAKQLAIAMKSGTFK